MPESNLPEYSLSHSEGEDLPAGFVVIMGLLGESFSAYIIVVRMETLRVSRVGKLDLS